MERCEACQGRGIFDLAMCPSVYADRRTLLALKVESRVRDGGRWPVAGGWLEQTQWTLDAVEFVERERAYLKAQAEAE